VIASKALASDSLDLLTGTSEPSRRSGSVNNDARSRKKVEATEGFFQATHAIRGCWIGFTITPDIANNRVTLLQTAGNLFVMKRVALTLVAVVALVGACFAASHKLAATVRQSSVQGSWYWFQTCSQKTEMGIEVLLDGRSVYRSVFPICKTSKPRQEPPQKLLAFRFKGGRYFEEREIQTHTTDSIEGNIWQAQSEPDALLLGVSFDDGKQILLNTIHIAEIDKPSTSEVDRGIVVKTFTVRQKK